MTTLPQSSSLPRYGYKPLVGDEIRLIHLLPGSDNQQIHAEIHHHVLKPRASLTDETDISTDNMKQSLPADWSCSKTPEGRWLFQYDNTDDGFCQYEHPTPESLPQDIANNLYYLATEPECPPEDEQLDWEALSYVWGIRTGRDVMYIETREGRSDGPSQLPMTQNLSSALRHLRRLDKARILWVDAICINQQDTVERDAQVIRMADIYASAPRVTVWLGESDEDSHTAFKLMQHLGCQIEITVDGHHYRPPHATEVDWVKLGAKLPYSPTDWEALTALMTRSWFSRVWVLQEVALANENCILYCGHDRILYYHFRRAVVGLRQRSGMPDDLQVEIEHKFHLSYGMKNSTLCDLLSVAREHECSVPHDKIYGLLGFVGSKLRAAITPSYETPFAEVFTASFIAHSESTARLELLAHCSPTEDFECPSWVPDWRSYGNRGPSILAAITLAAGYSRSSFRQLNANTLEVKGIITGSVSWAFKVLDSDNGGRVGSWLRKFMKKAIKSATYPTGETIDDAFAKLMCRNQVQERFTTGSLFPYLDEWQETLGELLERRDADTEDDLDLEGFVRIQWGHWETRRFFGLKDGYLGFGPMDIQPGDRICVILGLYCPLVIRPAGPEGFRVVGVCYVQGLMDSQALVGDLPDEWAVQEYNVQNRWRSRYYNEETEELTDEDPRLGPLPSAWHRVERHLTADDPEHVDFFENEDTGEVINYDPRLSVEALEERGVPLTTIRLI